MCSLCTYTLFLSESPNLIKDTASLKQKARQPCLAFCLFSVLILYSFPLGESTAHSSYKLIWPVVFDLGVNIHSDFAALMACQVLDRFGVHR